MSTFKTFTQEIILAMPSNPAYVVCKMLKSFDFNRSYDTCSSGKALFRQQVKPS